MSGRNRQCLSKAKIYDSLIGVRPPKTAGDIAMADALAEQRFLRETNVGDTFDILFDQGKKNESIYRGKIRMICSEWDRGLMVYVIFQYDGDMRKYHWKRFESLTLECNNFMKKMDIPDPTRCAPHTGVIFTQKR